MPSIPAVMPPALTVQCLLQVALEAKELMGRFTTASAGVIGCTTRFLMARAYQDDFNDLDASLRGCVGQLSCIVSISQLAAKVRVPSKKVQLSWLQLDTTYNIK